MNSNDVSRVRSGLAAALLGLGLAGAMGQADAAATLVITNANAAGVGFNDPTPVAPVGGNTGTTLGQQRLIAFQHAASIWGATLTSSVVINIQAQFVPLTCTSTGAVLGSAGATQVFSDFAPAIKPATWYAFALANKIAGTDLDPGVPQINARFNLNLGQPGCLDGTFFYLGLDNNHGSNVDLVTVLLHEFGHGLGFQTFTSGTTGATLAGQPSVWDHFMSDNTSGKLWVNMTDAERVASAVNARNLAWTGTNVSNSLPGVLSLGTPRMAVSGPAAGPAVGNYLVGAASFGPPLGATPVVGQLMPVVDSLDGSGLACTALNPRNALAVKGNIALVDRGTCGFVVKAANVQAAGAIGLVVADNAAGSPPPGLGGTDPSIVIPAVRITQADGAKLKLQLKKRSRTASGVIANLGVNGSQYAGADVLGRALLFTPNPFQAGSSVSHWDTVAFPNQLMEPAINDDLLHSVVKPADLTFELFKDIGW
jgi:PA domain